ncbi:UDP-N-acetylglucosamine 1-carboxyvinyltransferase [Friedmanniella endophytica]|uniref:UDP-N-acetylglucosamine 1-carboxyvinyltransferase n=1 Tax=Microlunatus kandeliicorticis TaxID=1759536 RepID=A0A7W3ITM1_9ACTN|nr:UDP-N-acetylglucosamine 1-carboxyvinyltransferase [Microlunatus kandeliicorticis]MBA8794990.1 UDP-N-acetylglucosamine 1-carboxyvinyltransferase [Microlunatus kandeliicorticis]
MTETSLDHIGGLIRDARKHRGLTQIQLATRLGTSQSAVHRIEAGNQNISVDMVNRIARALDSPILSVGGAGPTHLRVQGGAKLSGSIPVRSSKNAAVALLCASLLNQGTTVLRGIARIEEVNRILEVLTSIGVRATWSEDRADLTITRPAELDLAAMDVEAARRTRSVIMFLGPLLHAYADFRLPYAGGCDLGARTIEPHLQVLRRFGLSVLATDGYYHCTVDADVEPTRPITLTERGDTVTENALLAAAMTPGTTVLRNASPNYMVQDLCAFLMALGVQIEGVGTTTLKVHGVEEIRADVTYAPSEDPIEAMSLITAAIVTESELTIQRAPIEFLEIELSILEEMGLDFDLSDEYTAENGLTRLVDLTVRPSVLRAPIDKIHPMPFPGLNIDNLPFFAVIAATAEGKTIIHDWVYENRAIYLTELNRLGARVQLLDPHRVIVEGPTRWRGQHVVCPPALRPAVCILLGMLAARGESVLRDVYVINRGYEDLANRLNAVGANIEVFRD